jgi:hypothetical protein
MAGTTGPLANQRALAVSMLAAELLARQRFAQHPAQRLE